MANKTFTQGKTDAGLAVAIAQGQHHFDHDNNKWQAGIGVGQYGGNTAGSIGLAKVIGQSAYRPLLSISASKGGDDSHTGVGAGLSFEF